MTSDIELYFHIPFCVRKCSYCDFLSAPGDEATKRAYMRALTREAEERAPEYRDRQVVSVFIGGGTPSVVEAGQLTGILEAVGGHYRLAEDAEVTVEVNPGTVDRDKLDCYREAGINRLSIGLQSADDGELAALGRIHTWGQFLDTYASAVAAGFDNINVDVMSALPGQTLDSYRATLQRILELRPRPAHISAYSLILEEGTALWEQIREREEGEGTLPPGESAAGGVTLWPGGSLADDTLFLPDEDTDREMYVLTKEMLAQAGYERYEISNYARQGRECRHNCGYWRRRDYVGFGIGAASLVNNVRFSNGRDLGAYLAHPLDCREGVQILSTREQMEEFMFLGLRMTSGVSGEEFAACFGESMESIYGDVIERNLQDGLLGWRERRLALTERGLDLANYVMAQFL